MERVADLARLMHEEVADARKYAKMALLEKDTGSLQNAKTFAEIANQELGHADKLHSMAVDLIADKKRGGAEAPAGMERVWEYEHGRIIDETAAVRNLLQMFG